MLKFVQDQAYGPNGRRIPAKGGKVKFSGSPISFGPGRIGKIRVFVTFQMMTRKRIDRITPYRKLRSYVPTYPAPNP